MKSETVDMARVALAALGIGQGPLREVVDYLSSPPADDVREADAESLEDFMQDWYDRWAGPGETWAVRDMAASIVEEWLPKVRPRVKVTDAEVDAAASAYDAVATPPVLSSRIAMRAALEAAREAHP